ncbi:peptidylprolyl isomerase [Vibrio cholerae]|nr:peptidylprolyl isomerase [Vibrio cholerae]EGR2837321.1 peptidylprolyl isomerase [Vibrio cholerae]PAS39363.1 peptidylprolyl isomerase [Vibrio cholerae]PAS43689.1 peptidylprolyl isomerase [Vibrio cholerae]PAS44715.1 peptidylprolyl isomerase [Vibrio cholerae]
MPSKHVVTGSNPVGRAIISDPSKAHLLGFFIVILKSLFLSGDGFKFCCVG